MQFSEYLNWHEDKHKLAMTRISSGSTIQFVGVSRYSNMLFLHWWRGDSCYRASSQKILEVGIVFFGWCLWWVACSVCTGCEGFVLIGLHSNVGIVVVGSC
jgi:hypothetical protein